MEAIGKSEERRDGIMNTIGEFFRDINKKDLVTGAKIIGGACTVIGILTFVEVWNYMKWESKYSLKWK